MNFGLIQRDSRKALAATYIVQKKLLPAIQGEPLNCLMDSWDHPGRGWEWQNNQRWRKDRKFLFPHHHH